MLSFSGLDPEEHRPPPELFAWDQDRGKRPEQTPSPNSSPISTNSLGVSQQDSSAPAGLPGIRRSVSAADRPPTMAGMKRKGPATTGGEAFGLGCSRVSGGGAGGRRKASTQGAAPTGLKSNYSAVRGTEGTWQFIARAKSVRETPVSRGDALGLVREFQAAMAVLDDPGGGGEGQEGAFTSPMQNDMHALHHEVGRNFGARAAVVEAVQIMDCGRTERAGGAGSRNGLGAKKGQWRDIKECKSTAEQEDEDKVRETGDEYPDAGKHTPLGLTGEWVRSAIGMGPDGWAAAQRTLGRCLFEQKWLDLTCGELCEQVSVMCLPHGQLLQEMRRRNASAFNRLHGLYSDCLWTLDKCVASVLEGRRERKTAEEDWTRKLAATCADYEARIKAIHDSRGSEEQEQARAKREAKAQVDRMGDTLRTLNGIFKTMQADGKAMTEVELKDRCRALEHELASRKQEMNDLRRLKEKHLAAEAEMQQVKQELQHTKMQAAKVTEEMERRQSLVKELMENEAKRLTEIEAMKAGNDRVGYGDDDDDEEGKDRDEEQPRAEKGSKNRAKRKPKHKKARGGGKETLAAVGDDPSQASGNLDGGRKGGEWGAGVSEDEEEDEEEIGSSVLCIKCRKALDDLSNIADALEKERQLKGQTRLQCHGYRLMLPNLKGYRPARTVAWVRTVMRAILRAKIWDDSVLRYKQDLRVRFPEFVYAWFEPPRALLAATNAGGKSKLVAQADDDRWGLYYGVKALANESAEATLFWHALNESNGEDYLTFLVYCLAIVEGTVGSLLREQWGVSAMCTDLYTLKSKILEESKTDTDRENSRDRGHVSGGGFDNKPKGGGGGGGGGAGVAGKGGEGSEQAEPLASGRDVVWLLSSDAIETVDHVLVKALEDQKRKVLDATRAIAVSCEGRLPGQDPSSTCVDLFLFLRIMLHSFKEEQVNRRAAVRLMFETAATGVLTDSTPIYGDGRVDQSALAAAETVYDSLLNESKATVDLPQFMAIARTLWPEVTTSDAVAVFRDAHEETNGEVDYQVGLYAFCYVFSSFWCFFAGKGVHKKKTTSWWRWIANTVDLN